MEKVLTDLVVAPFGAGREGLGLFVHRFVQKAVKGAPVGARDKTGGGSRSANRPRQLSRLSQPRNASLTWKLSEPEK